MKNISPDFENKLNLLKLARLKLLSLHKVLIDQGRVEYEKINGQITSGQFLNLLLNEPSFQWLRRFSTLVVEIDEMLDLDDGFSEVMVEDKLTQIKNLIYFEQGDDEFGMKFEISINNFPEVALKYEEIKSILQAKEKGA